MDNIFSKIDKIFELENDTTPKWAQELLFEIREVKKLLQKETIAPKTTICQRGTDIKSFIMNFRKTVKQDEMFIYQGRELGINSRGLLYDINTNSILKTQEAYEVYGYIYKHDTEIKNIRRSA